MSAPMWKPPVYVPRTRCLDCGRTINRQHAKRCRLCEGIREEAFWEEWQWQVQARAWIGAQTIRS